MARAADRRADIGAPARGLLPTLGDLAKFTALVALLAILTDAAVGHALQWENDPYWTYWITKTFLIATVFGLGTAWFGVGAGRGAVITVVHTIILTVYYWSLSPIGLPAHPDWLDLEHTWITGIPIHFGVIYVGYLAALWLWRRRARLNDAVDLRARAFAALGLGAVVVIVTGAAEAFALGEFQGATWYVVRLLITVPFILAWNAAAGSDTRAAVGGSIVLTAILTAYSHFLGPVGLPDVPLRIFERAAPGATVHWLGYTQEFLVAAPLTLAVTTIAFVLASRRSGVRIAASSVERRAGALALALAILGAVVAAIWVDPAGDKASVTAAGALQIEHGPWYGDALSPSSGTFALHTVDRNPRVTPLPPHDIVDLDATVATPKGQVSVRATHPMVDDPSGRLTTWWGVGYGVWHHGRSGIGTPKIPAVRSHVAIFALGTVSLNGQVIANGVPVHAMTMDKNMLELDVGLPGSELPALPDQHLRAIWPVASVSHSHKSEFARYAYGGLVLVALLLLALAAVSAEREPELA
jgi:hypothetical protein